METTIFQFHDYKAYLNAWLHSQPSEGYGFRGKFAKAMGCQTAFVSQVLSGEAHFSLEQAERLNSLLGHSKEEGSFFLLLVQFTRAGSEPLRAHFREQMDAVQAKRANLKERLSSTRTVSEEDHTVYFSSWAYVAVHAFLMIPPHQTKASIAIALRLPSTKVGAILEFLVSRGLANQNGDRYSVGPLNIHFGHDSSMIAKHHLNWRLQAMQAIEAENPKALHYSSVVCISKEDAEKVRELCAQFLEQVREKVSPSPEEELHGVCLDYFPLVR